MTKVYRPELDSASHGPPEEGAFTEVSQDTIDRLKVLGYKSLRSVLLRTSNPHQATVELVPLRSADIDLDIVDLNSSEVNYYIAETPMAKYVLRTEYLDPAGSPSH